jgi:hypothetical protein
VSHYRPASATLVVSGRFDPDLVRAHVDAAFGRGQRGGRSQDSCRLNIYAVLLPGSDSTESRSGLSVTMRMGSQLRVARDQRSGCLALARA